MIDIKRGIFMIMGASKISESHWVKAIGDELEAKKADFTLAIDGRYSGQNAAATTVSTTYLSYKYCLFRNG